MKTIILAACLSIGLQLTTPVGGQPRVYNLPCYEQYRSMKLPYKHADRYEIVNLGRNHRGDNNGIK